VRACTVLQLCYRLNLLTIDLLIKIWFYAIVCKFTTLILSFQVWGLGLGLGTVGLVNITGYLGLLHHWYNPTKTNISLAGVL